MADEQADERTVQLEFDFSDIDDVHDAIHVECKTLGHCHHYIFEYMKKVIESDFAETTLRKFLHLKMLTDAGRGETTDSRDVLCALIASSYVQGALYGRHKILNHQLEAIGRLSGESEESEPMGEGTN